MDIELIEVRSDHAVAHVWNAELKRNEEKRIEFKDIVRYINHQCELSSSVTVQTLLDIVAQDPGFWSLHCSVPVGYWIAEALKPEEESKLEHVKISRRIEVSNYPEDNTCDICTDISGRGPWEDGGWGESQPPDGQCNYAISFTPMNRLKNLPVILDCNTIMNQYAADNKTWDSKEAGKTRFTLAQIIYALFWEVSWNGIPEARDEMWKDLMDRVDEIKEEKSIDLEDMT